MDFKIQSPEDQQKFVVPLNRDSETLFYSQRMIIDANVLTEPRAWKISKVNRLSPNGLNRITLAQDRFDQHYDYIEKNNDGNVIGMWADYYRNGVEPLSKVKITDESTSIVKIIHSGNAPLIKIGGSYKTISLIMENKEGEMSPVDNVGDWSFSIDGEDVSNLLQILTSRDSDAITDNQIKIKFIGDYSYFGKILVVSNTSSETPLELQIAGL